jgi:predicted enzyme related to lactoylglutathione lyase
MPSNKLTK